MRRTLISSSLRVLNAAAAKSGGGFYGEGTLRLGATRGEMRPGAVVLCSHMPGIFRPIDVAALWRQSQNMKTSNLRWLLPAILCQNNRILTGVSQDNSFDAHCGLAASGDYVNSPKSSLRMFPHRRVPVLASFWMAMLTFQCGTQGFRPTSKFA